MLWRATTAWRRARARLWRAGGWSCCAHTQGEAAGWVELSAAPSSGCSSAPLSLQQPCSAAHTSHGLQLWANANRIQRPLALTMRCGAAHVAAGASC